MHIYIYLIFVLLSFYTNLTSLAQKRDLSKGCLTIHSSEAFLCINRPRMIRGEFSLFIPSFLIRPINLSPLVLGSIILISSSILFSNFLCLFFIVFFIYLRSYFIIYVCIHISFTLIDFFYFNFCFQ